MINDFNLFKFGQDILQTLLERLAIYNIYPAPTLKLCQADGILCFYNPQDSLIYLGLPNLTNEGQLLLFKFFLGFDNRDDILAFYRLILPYLIAHELGHHLRHHYGLMGNNVWHEEQVANQFATAMTNTSLSNKITLCQLLEPIIAGLKKKLAGQSPIAHDLYHNIWATLHTLPLSATTLDHLKILSYLFNISPLELITQNKLDSNDINQRLAQRPLLINQMNQEYASNLLLYSYYQMSWFYISLTTHEQVYLDDFARQHLGLTHPLLPLISTATPTTENHVKALFQAYQDTLPHSTVTATYFYQRYRTSLLTYLQTANFPQAETLRRETPFLLQTWRGHEDTPDILAQLTFLLPPHLHPLLPHQLVTHIPPDFSTLTHLPTETDQRLWQYIVTSTPDPAANNTLTYLTLLSQTELAQGLPAEAWLELAHLLCTIKLEVGDTLMWQGELNCDVYILTEGELTVWISQTPQQELTKIGPIAVWVDQQDRQVATVHIGQVLGEIEFFTRQPCQATVRASTPAECLVLKSLDLSRLAYKYPAIFQQLGLTLAHRLSKMNEKLF